MKTQMNKTEPKPKEPQNICGDSVGIYERPMLVSTESHEQIVEGLLGELYWRQQMIERLRLSQVRLEEKCLKDLEQVRECTMERMMALDQRAIIAENRAGQFAKELGELKKRRNRRRRMK